MDVLNQAVRRAAALALGLPLAACGSPADSGTTAPTSNVFVAFTDDFAGFHDWHDFPVVRDVDAGVGTDVGVDTNDAGVHIADDPMIEYVKNLPPAGARKFAVGTIIVKEVATGALTDRKVFAMVKRGGNFDKNGAVGWEWFELSNLSSKAVRIVWRGVGPKMGEKYGGDPRICNECHVSSENDAVLSQALQLQNF